MHQLLDEIIFRSRSAAAGSCATDDGVVLLPVPLMCPKCKPYSAPYDWAAALEYIHSHDRPHCEALRQRPGLGKGVQDMDWSEALKIGL